jgi:hypothetical protein
MSRRRFLTLAGAGAVFGAVILVATRQKGIQEALKAAMNGPATNRATAGKVIMTPGQPASPTLLQKLLGGKL